MNDPTPRERVDVQWPDRHFSTREVLVYLVPNDNLPAHLWQISNMFWGLTVALMQTCSDSPELTVALRKLLESKDAAVRARLEL